MNWKLKIQEEGQTLLMILTCFVFITPWFVYPLIMIILLIEVSDFPSSSGLASPALSVYWNCCRVQADTEPLQQHRVASHTQMLSPTSPRTEHAQTQPASCSADGSLAVIRAWKDEKWQEQWEAKELRDPEVWGKANSCFITRPTHKRTPTHEKHTNIYSKRAHTSWL